MGVVEIVSSDGMKTYGYEGHVVVTIEPNRICVDTRGKFTAAARKCLQSAGFKNVSVANRHYTFELPGYWRALHFQSSVRIWFKDDANTKLDQVFIDGKCVHDSREADTK